MSPCIAFGGISTTNGYVVLTGSTNDANCWGRWEITISQLALCHIPFSLLQGDKLRGTLQLGFGGYNYHERMSTSFGFRGEYENNGVRRS